jgi:hypothetical protein
MPGVTTDYENEDIEHIEELKKGNLKKRMSGLDA